MDEDQLWQDVSDITAQALENFVEMRGVEGAKMLADITGRLIRWNSAWAKSKPSAPAGGTVHQRLYERLKTILEDRTIDDARILTEAAIFGDKTAVDEETVRLRSHIAQYRQILGSNEPVGRKLDFFDPGAQPRIQHHRLQVPGPGHHPDRGGHEGRDRENPRADSESGVRVYETDQHRGLAIWSAPSGWWRW